MDIIAEAKDIAAYYAAKAKKSHKKSGRQITGTEAVMNFSVDSILLGAEPKYLTPENRAAISAAYVKAYDAA